jgi:RNA polymerase sigma-70 factor (ECF subfamily)
VTFFSRVAALPLRASGVLSEAAVCEKRREHPVEVCATASLKSVYGELSPRVYRFQRDMLGDAALAQDATQETFVRAFLRVDDLPPGTRLVPWVFGVARRVSLELRRARGRALRLVVPSPAQEAFDEPPDIPDPRGRTPEAELLDREALLVVEAALSRLPEDRRAAMLLRIDHGLSYEDIAELMDWSLPKTKIEIFRAREVLRATFDEYREGAP